MTAIIAITILAGIAAAAAAGQVAEQPVRIPVRVRDDRRSCAAPAPPLAWRKIGAAYENCDFQH